MPEVGGAGLEAALEKAAGEPLQTPAVLGGNGVPGLRGPKVEQVYAANIRNQCPVRQPRLIEPHISQHHHL